MSAVSGPSGPERASAGMAGELEGETFEHRGPLETGTLRYIRGAGTGVIVVGAVCLICGVIAVVWPKITLLALAILILSRPKISSERWRCWPGSRSSFAAR